MNEDFITYELAVKLKKKGFGWRVDCAYEDGGECKYIITEYDVDYIPAPTISQVLKWLREEKKIYCLPHFDQGIDKWLFYIASPNAGCEFVEFISGSIYDTYEEAALAGIEYYLEHF